MDINTTSQINHEVDSSSCKEVKSSRDDHNGGQSLKKRVDKVARKALDSMKNFFLILADKIGSIFQIIGSAAGALVRKVQNVARYGFNLDAKLHKAAAGSGDYTVKELIKAGANPGAANEYFYTPLHRASRAGDVESVKELIQHGADVNILTASTRSGVTPLHLACEQGVFEVVKILTKAGANPNIKNLFFYTPLHIACRSGKLEIIRELIDSGANPNLANQNGETALHIASDLGSIAMVRELISAGADPKIAGWDCFLSSLEVACKSGRLEVVKELVRGEEDVKSLFTKDLNEKGRETLEKAIELLKQETAS